MQKQTHCTASNANLHLDTDLMQNRGADGISADMRPVLTWDEIKRLLGEILKIKMDSIYHLD